MTSKNEYVVHSFKHKGVTESIRLLLTYLDLKWTDQIYDTTVLNDPVFQTEIPLHRSNPVLEIKSSNERLFDHVAIGQYLGDMHNLHPVQDFDKAKALELADGFTANINGMLTFLANIPGGLPKSWKEERVSYINNQHVFEKFLFSFVVPRVHQLDKWMGTQAVDGFIPGFLFGREPCWADFYVYNNLRLLQSIPGTWVKGQFYVWLEQFLENVQSLPRIADFIDQRKDVAYLDVDPNSLIILPPYREPEAERVIRMLPLPDENWSSDEDDRRVIPKWDYEKKEERRAHRRRIREQQRSQWETEERKQINERK